MKKLTAALKKTRYLISRRAFARLRYRLYWTAVACLRRWPIPGTPLNKKIKVSHAGRVAYFIWQYPVVSQTFVQREVAALGDSARAVFVVSDIPAEDESISDLAHPTACLQAIAKKTLRRYKRHFFFSRPILYLHLFIYVFGHDYHGYKCLNFDQKLFSKSIALAALLQENGISHVHSPWADNCALIALLASRLLGITYSVQARAHDVHRKTYLCGLGEKLNNADFIITNTEYNGSHIKSIIGAESADKLQVIYNGLSLAQFRPGEKEKTPSPVPKILSVARLIEQKGLTYLLKACDMLRNQGCTFTCEIIGGPETPLFMNYYVALKKLHRRLRLEDCVFFLDTQPFERVLEKYREADVFVLPSVIAEDGSRDITPNVLIEAMAMKLPVISTTVTGIPEIVENGVSGFLVPPNDERALADAVHELIYNAPLRKELGENARKRIGERFDVDKNIRRYVDLFSGSRPNAT